MTDAKAPFSGRTAWARNLQTPLRMFLRTETGSAAVLLAATVVALVWVNLDARSYESFWHTELSIAAGDHGVALDFRHWINAGLMTFFFFVVGLEARREFDMGELRERRRLMLPVVAGLAGMVVPILIYLLLNAGKETAAGWGTAMSTDTAFALGVLAVVGPRFPAALRVFVLTVTVVDDLVALVVITAVYSEHHVSAPPLLVAIAIFGVVLTLKTVRVRNSPMYFLLGLAVWVGLVNAGVEPIIVGLAMGLLTYAQPPARVDLEHAYRSFRLFRVHPTPEAAREADIRVRRAISPNERLAMLFHPWTSYLIVPLFALANAGVVINGELVSRAVTSPVTLGIVIGSVLGKLIGTVGGTVLVTRLSRGRLRPPVGWAAVAGSGLLMGVGFTVSLLIASLAFTGDTLDEAKFGILSAALLGSVLAWALSRATALLPAPVRDRALLGTAERVVDLAVPVDPDRDHIRGPHQAPITVVEYGDLECPWCHTADDVVRRLLDDCGDVRYVWRHLPIGEVHPNATLAAQACEAAAAQGRFWDMHALLLEYQKELLPMQLVRHAARLGLNVSQFSADLRGNAGAGWVAQDVDSADLSGVSGTPTFFINGLRHHGNFDLDALSAAIRDARRRTELVP
ncbi:MAG TPA: Na+/H+ antiporter NhaA [Actinophytocola sp.]|uniref:Na+/H+ antiporter NhaA n=1 Tax=Actinophytocola sp. TaxID=1872138 RepID=UPI002DB7EC04|nr:Na+/H+ antiporter NhaA [Actinophytocola sp.]HEU5473720.1 Na+/H+ antiporter NhaA [Actinophytocola sp.]